MKINESGRVNAVQNYRKAQGIDGANAVGKKNRKDEVVISSQAKELLEAQASNQVEMSERLQRIKASIEDGTYTIDAHKLADKLYPYLK